MTCTERIDTETSTCSGKDDSCTASTVEDAVGLLQVQLEVQRSAGVLDKNDASQTPDQGIMTPWQEPLHHNTQNGSQFGQDEWALEQHAKSQTNDSQPFFLDLGANDGYFCSNTVKLEQNGWRGICVEPFPINFNGRKCSLIQKALSNKVGNVTFSKCGVLGGIQDDLGKYDKKVTSSCPDVSIPATTVSTMLQEAGSNVPAVIDFASLDVEGAEMTVLETFPFDKHCVRTWTIEHNGEEPKRTEIQKFMQGHGCALSTSVQVDDYFTCDCSESSLVQNGMNSLKEIASRAEPMPVWTKPRKDHIAVAVALGPKAEHLLEFLVMLHSSWEHVLAVDDGSPTNALVDLLVSCEKCSDMPVGCTPMKMASGQLQPYVAMPRCMYAPSQDPLNSYFKKFNHPAMLSVSFLAAEPMRSILSRYTYVLRTDEDAVITPRILTWRPPNGMVFGNAGVEIDWTKARLKAIAKRLQWRYQDIHNICSGWYVPPTLAVSLADHAILAAKELLENEYGYRYDTGEYMAPRVKLGNMTWWKKDNKDGEWPKWWQPVTSLYASNLAINHVVDNLTNAVVTKDIDFSTTENDSIMKHVHLHAIQGAHGFNKFRFLDEIRQQPSASTFGMDWQTMLAHFQAMNEQYPVADFNETEVYSDTAKYTMWIVSRSLASAAAVFLDKEDPIPLVKNDTDWYRIVNREDNTQVRASGLNGSIVISNA